MTQCSERTYAMCPDRALCGSRNKAVFTENSECAKFNRTVEDIPMTNAERIRAMSDEELAMVIMCPDGMDDLTCSGDGACAACCLHWLQQPPEV